MLESIVELLGGLFLSTLPLLFGSCIVGSIVAALRGVSHENDCQREDVNQVFDVVAEVTVLDDRMIETASS